MFGRAGVQASVVWSLHGTGGQGSGSSSLFWSERSWSLVQSHPALLPFSNYRTLWNPHEEAERDPGIDNAQDFLPCSPSSTGNENIKTQVHLLPDLAELTECRWGGHGVGPCNCAEPHAVLTFSHLTLHCVQALLTDDLPTSTQPIRGKTEPQGLQTGIGCNMRIVGELFKNTVEIPGLPPQTLSSLVWRVLKHSQEGNYPDMPWSGLTPI